MQLNGIDWTIIGSFILLSLFTDIMVSRRAGGNADQERRLRVKMKKNS